MSKTGRQTVMVEGRTFIVEAISDHPDRGGDWGKTDLSNHPLGGAIMEDESVITEENGFKNIIKLGVGESPYSAIERLLEKQL